MKAVRKAGVLDRPDLARPVEHRAYGGGKIETQEFEGNQAGLDAAVAWLHDRYHSEPERWENIPSILDCEPDR